MMIQKLKFLRDHWSLVFCLILILVNMLVWRIIYESAENVLTVAFLDVGQGDAIFIETPNGNQILIDAGSGRQVLRALHQMMPFYDRSIDLLIATHPDTDHIGGFPEVFKRYDIGIVMESGVISETATAQAFHSAAIQEVRTTTLARRGMKVILGRDLVLEILFPDRDPTGWETNTASIVARLTYGASVFLLTGDSPIKIENYLLGLESSPRFGETSRRLQSAVLKVGHHGSNTSNDPAFLAAVTPKYAIISAGENNRYGHPHESVLESLRKIGAKILRTDELDTIIFQTDGETLSLCPC